MKIKWFPVWAAASVLAIAVISLAWWDANDILHSALGLIAAVTGMMYTMLAGRGKIVCYAFGLVNAPIYAYLAYRWGYYGDMALNLYYFVMMVPGIICWRRNRTETSGGEIVRTALPGKMRVVWGLSLVVAALVLYAVLLAVGGSRPLCDALTNVLSVAAMILTVKRCIEQWVMWIAVDAIEMFMWWHTGETSMAILAMWTLFLADGTYLFHLWIAEFRNGRVVAASREPQNEAMH